MGKVVIIGYVKGKPVYSVSGGQDMFAPDFQKFRFYDDDAGEAASAPLEDEDIDHTLLTDTDQAIQFRAFFQAVNAEDGTTMDDWQVDYDKNSTGFTALTTTDTGTGIRAVTAGLTNDTATTNRTTNGISDGTGSFVAGEQSSDGLVDDMQLTGSNYTEHAYGIEFVAANVADTDTFDFEFSSPGGVVNSIVPRITISKTPATGFPQAFDHLSMMHN